MVKEKMQRKKWPTLCGEEKRTILQSIADNYTDFTLVEYKHFEQFGRATDSAVFRHKNGGEFVFVPGDKVTLGWDSFTEGMDEITCLDLSETLAEFGIEDIHSFVRENTSPLRTKTIAPMLVERSLQQIGWRPVQLDDPEIKNNENLLKFIEDFRSSNYKSSTLKNNLRLKRNDGVIYAELYRAVSYADFVQSVLASGFRLPTEDEWEYLCGCGSRTLWRWGDSFDFNFKLHHFEEANTADSEYDLDKANEFGLQIAFDPYMMEVVMDSEVIAKGGDGGCNICGGMGMTAGYLPVATAFRGYAAGQDEFGYMENLDGDFVFYRRILRLD